ncbi:2-amino-4-hydroxy-6-hydroxymethyldihydropteridine diphosphokinase [Nitrosomonas sp. Nm58]|jgi:2-amino-4-hydroxy-6-hydroxymethyldihydropteridine diphosphokinase|uniref:2-amino-4-hydroxy-6- hydroxymethyldihydropteridine diphosphokinase n=1 Tax=Nitrosomonas sp. Nm58 TaxID=200126 RepID=UPI00089C59F8|nr:2-amino-4-hydroxy-6-hydroxymethyldihydropteridine diphosphokinase [Nitrosomonas sp. Nm58]SDY05604.1 2-amino-4-hydroxy-6-hydroxymethyldihydropteridinediphosphokinase [Nitrosomonas sp. Nm58]
MPATGTQPARQAFIGLGSNLKNPLYQIRRAISLLAALPDCRLIKQSSLYRSAPMGSVDQPDFINAVVHLQTTLMPHDLLRALLEIERRCGRIRTYPNAPRTLDLDLLLYDDLQCHEEGLTLPHPRMHERAFVLQPLMEIKQDCMIPGQGLVTGLLAACTEQRLECISTS